jgi:hypothetical protein
MKRIDHIRTMPIEKMAEIIVTRTLTDDYCDNSCKRENGCPHPEKCCVRWLNKEVGE